MTDEPVFDKISLFIRKIYNNNKNNNNYYYYSFSSAPLGLIDGLVQQQKC